jgi:hypothetical protein
MKLIYILKKNLRVYFILAFKMEIDGPLAQFSFLRNAFNRHGFETFFEEKLSGRFEDNTFSDIFFPFPSSFKHKNSRSSRKSLILKSAVLQFLQGSYQGMNCGHYMTIGHISI